MKCRLPIGIEQFKEMTSQNYYYVDKTLLIKELLDQGSKVNLFTRPRRFGKTLALSMLRTFFEQEVLADGTYADNRKYFEGLNIMDAGEKYTKELGQYPVIFLSLKSAKQPNYELAYENLIIEIQREFERHAYILNSSELSDVRKQNYKKILDATASPATYPTAVRFLSECLQKYHHKEVIILLDEYDVPLENAYYNGFYDEMIAFIRSLFESALKTNDALKLAVITGCLRISRESIFTGLNNLRIVSILTNDYGEYFGFTPEETTDMLAYYGLSDHMEQAKLWYNGYRFGMSEIYNPWSIINYVIDQLSGEKFCKPYWSNTSSNSIVRDLIEKADENTRSEIEILMEGGTIEKPIHEDITYDSIYDSQNNLWNVLFFTGYLKNCGMRQEGRSIYLKLAIPNEEIACIYDQFISQWFQKKASAVDKSPFLHALEDGDCDTASVFLNQQLRATISYQDSAENYYHGFLSGLLSGNGLYRVKSNRESGNGRPDIVLESLDGETAIILELKYTKKFSELEQKCKDALKQIDTQGYENDLYDDGYPVVLKYGISFFKKRCRIEKG